MTRASEKQRRQTIAEEAYFRAQRRGFEGGDPVADWLLAEQDIDSRPSMAKGAVGELEERLTHVNERLKALRSKVSAMTSDARREWEDDLDKLEKLRNRFRNRLKGVREHGGHAAENAKRQAEKIWDEISHIVARSPIADRPSSRKRGRR